MGAEVSAAQRYVERRLQEGKSRREALRALKRHLARTIFRTIKRDLASGRTPFALTWERRAKRGI